MSMAALMGISAALSSESINSTLESQVKPVMSVANKAHQYTPLGMLTDWLSVQTTEADIWKPSDDVKDAIYRELEQRLSLAMEWRMEPSLALLPWRGQAAWDALYAETSDVPDDFVSRHKDRYDGRLPISEDPETVALYREFFESDREVSTDAGETPVSAP